jgi:hypothetical protein
VKIIRCARDVIRHHNDKARQTCMNAEIEEANQGAD